MRLITLGFAACLAASAQELKIPESVVLEKDIDYAPVLGGRLQMDVARPKAGSGHPAVVLIHGGGFHAGNRASQLPFAVRLAEEGFVAATITYRLAPKFQFPSPVFDAKSAVRFLRANAGRFRLDGSRICAAGSSAGAHLSLFLGLTGGVAAFEGDGPNREQSSRVSCVVSYAGPTDFTRIYAKGFDAADVLPQFLGGDLRRAWKAHIESSPLNWVSPDDAAVLMVHGTADNYVPYEQALWLGERLTAAGVEAEIATFPGGGHGLRGQQREEADARAIEFLKRHLKPAPAGRRLLISNHGRPGAVMAIEWPSGRVLWSIPNDQGHDVQPLPDGGVLITTGRGARVAEYGPDRAERWSITASHGLKQPISAQRLPDGNTLVSDTQLGKVLEFDRAGKVVWEYTHEEFKPGSLRCARRTAAGTTLIANERTSTITEVDRAGKIVWRWQAPNPNMRRTYQALRMPDGTTAVSISDPGELLFVDAAGKVVRTIGNAGDPTSGLKFGWVSGVWPAADGTVFVADYTGRRIAEINAKGELVNELRNVPWSIASIAVP